MDYPEFTGTAASLLSQHVRMLRNVIKGLEIRPINEYDIEDLKSIESETVALLGQLPEHLAGIVRI